MKTWQIFLAFCLITFVTLLETPLIAGPTIIRDNRIFDLATTPALGRGYSISTNTFQSTCMKDVKITEPSYDFDYTFESLEKEDTERSGSTTGSTADVSFLAFDLKSTTTSTEVEGKSVYYHHVRVEINMHTYYASIDESATNLSDPAKTLLLNSDIPGFFHSCGSYYVRSIGRTAKFTSVFTYMDESNERNKSFELQLELAITGFGGQLEKILADNDTDPSVALANKNSFETVAKKKKLTITTKAWGLGKNKNATLIAYDLPTYKAAIKEAFISMQNPMTGRVSTMEVIPWVENASFQNFINLEEDTENDDGDRLLLFEKKKILNLNAEYLAQIGRTDRNLMDMYYKAMICKQTIDSRWKRGGKLLPSLVNADIQSNKSAAVRKIEELEEELTQQKIDMLLTNEDQFMYGNDGKSGASACMREIVSRGIFRVSWRNIPICRELRTQFSTIINVIIDNYCMPKLAKAQEN
ncbi:MAG: hypothetical protein GY786_03840 [Proteobacteria bacterium]|nr:hypothetical protein [Pseudomonadota bacterium]